MQLTDGKKREIDEMPYESMLRINRFAAIGDRRFQGDAGTYFLKVMTEKRREVGDAEHTACSKRIGWDR